MCQQRLEQLALIRRQDDGLIVNVERVGLPVEQKVRPLEQVRPPLVALEDVSDAREQPLLPIGLGLSTKDGTKNNFVDYFNGDSSEETLEDLNGFDKNNKYELQELFWLFRDGYIGKNVQKDDSGKYEITAEIEDTVTSNFYINGTNTDIAMKYTKTSKRLENLKRKSKLILNERHHIPLDEEYDKEKLSAIIDCIANQIDREYVNATLAIEKDGTFKRLPSKEGKKVQLNLFLFYQAL